MSLRRFLLATATALALAIGPMGATDATDATDASSARGDDPGDGGGSGIHMKWRHKWVKTRYNHNVPWPDYRWQMCKLSLSRPYIDANRDRRPVRARMILRCPHPTNGTKGSFGVGGYHVANSTSGYLGGPKMWHWSKKLKLYKYKVERGIRYVGDDHGYASWVRIWTGKTIPHGTKRYRAIRWEHWF